MAASSELLKRIITGTVLISFTLLVIWLDHIFLPIGLLIFITFSFNEYYRFWHRKNIYPHTIAAFLPGFVIPLLVYFEVPLLIPSFVLFFFICFLSVLRYPGSRHDPNFLAEVTAVVLGVIYISVMPSALIALRKLGFEIALMPLILTWLYDTFAYITGRALGRHRLYEKVSPKKTWEGAILGLILTLPFAYFLCRVWVPKLNFADACIITLAIGILGTIGDLFESAMKREVGLKDASKVFPGHGGFLDRLDSLIFNLPFFYLYLLYRG